MARFPIKRTPISGVKNAKNAKNAKASQNNKASAKGSFIKGAGLGLLANFASGLFGFDGENAQNAQNAQNIQNTLLGRLGLSQDRDNFKKKNAQNAQKIPSSEKFKLTIDLDETIKQDKKLKDISNRLTNAMYGINANIPKIKLTKASKETSASPKDIKGLTKSVNKLNDHFRLTKGTITDESAKKLLKSNQKIEELLQKISDDMIDEQDTSIKPIGGNLKGLKLDNKTLIALMGAMGVSGAIGNSGALGALGALGAVGISGSNSNDDSTGIDSATGALLGAMGVQSALEAKNALSKKNSNVSNNKNTDKNTDKNTKNNSDSKDTKTNKASESGKKKPSFFERFERVKNNIGERFKAVKDGIPNTKVAKTLKLGRKLLPGVGNAIALSSAGMDAVDAIKLFRSGDNRGGIDALANFGVSALGVLPFVGNALLAADFASSATTGKSLGERATAFFLGDREGTSEERIERANILDDLDKSGIITKKGVLRDSTLNDKESIEALPAEAIQALIDHNDWTDEDNKYLNDLLKQKISDGPKKDTKLPERLKKIGLQIQETQEQLMKSAAQNADFAKALDELKDCKDVREGERTLAERFGRVGYADLYVKLFRLKELAYRLGHASGLKDAEIEKYLKVGNFDQSYLKAENADNVLFSVASVASVEAIPKKALDAIENQQEPEDLERYDLMLNAYKTSGQVEGGGAGLGVIKRTFNGTVSAYTGEITTVGGSALVLNAEIGGPYAKQSQKRGIRNNNPGNIVKSATKWEGKIPHEKNTDKRFEQFCAPEFGIRAIGMLLQTYQNKYKLYTIRDMINKWAPSFENNTSAYVTFVVKMFNQSSYDKAKSMTADTPFTITDPNLMMCMIKGIITQENGEQPYPDSVIKRACNASLGVEKLSVESTGNVTKAYDLQVTPSGVSSPVALDSHGYDDRAGAEGNADISNNFGLNVNNTSMPSGFVGQYLGIASSQAKGATYSQENRMGAKSFDCSSFVCRALQGAGLDISPAQMTTRNMKDILTKKGFSWNAQPIGEDTSFLKPGDIMLNEQSGHGHTEIFIGNGGSIGAHSTESGVSARKHWSGYDYQGFLRYNGSGSFDASSVVNNDISFNMPSSSVSRVSSPLSTSETSVSTPSSTPSSSESSQKVSLASMFESNSAKAETVKPFKENNGKIVKTRNLRDGTAIYTFEDGTSADSWDYDFEDKEVSEPQKSTSQTDTNIANSANDLAKTTASNNASNGGNLAIANMFNQSSPQPKQHGNSEAEVQSMKLSNSQALKGQVPDFSM